MRARDVMTTEVVSVGPQTTVREIASLLIQRRISAVPVLEGGRLIGIVSEGDLMRRPETDTDSGASPWLSLFAGPGVAPDRFAKVHGMTAREVMTRDVVTIAPDAPLDEVARLLESRRIKRVPVVEGRRLVGIVSRANLLQGFALSAPTWPMLRDDRQIRDALNRALKEAGLPMHQVNVTVNNGAVRLWGWIDAEVQRQAAHAAAEATPGVERVEDNLVVSTAAVRAGRGYV